MFIPGNYHKNAKKILSSFLTKLDAREKDEMLLLAKNWGAVATNLEDLVKALSEKESLTKDKLYKLDLYKQFLAESRNQIREFSQETASIISSEQLAFGTAGIGVTQGELSLITVNFNRLPIDAIKTFVGLSKDGTPLYKLLVESYPETTTKLTNTLLNSIALGRNPIETARLMQVDMNGNLTRALKIARTEQMNVFRESSLLQMQESEIVNEWEWIAEEDACDFCLEKDGKRFPLGESMDTHPNCRCGELPII